ncbi:MAG: hypothetical protein IKE31_05780 [Eubacterium sp.]|nr:hypothetical protein [Eubacterium sp.]
MKKKLSAVPFGRKRKPPVTDPIRDAEDRFGMPFLIKQQVSLWEEDITRHTTQEFARIGKGFRRHCGPTAITNLILTLHHRHRYLKEPVSARNVFAEVSEIGRKKGIYWNTDFLNMFGGTYDVLTRIYIRDCLKHYGIPARIGGTFLSSKARALKALEEGKLLYLQLLYHPIYGNHHLLAYGYTVLHSVNGRQKEVYLILADGWSRQPRYLRFTGPGIRHFLEVS